MTHPSPLILDVAGLALTAADQQRLAHPLVGGVILFGRNWDNREQLTRLCGQIKAVRTDLLIAVDHEGGRVQRFRSDGFTHLPPMAALGRLWMAPEKKNEMVGASIDAVNDGIGRSSQFVVEPSSYESTLHRVGGVRPTALVRR